jgi:hypothetical protein
MCRGDLHGLLPFLCAVLAPSRGCVLLYTYDSYSIVSDIDTLSILQHGSTV